jgi:hypothetical protein
MLWTRRIGLFIFRLYLWLRFYGFSFDFLLDLFRFDFLFSLLHFNLFLRLFRLHIFLGLFKFSIFLDQICFDLFFYLMFTLNLFIRWIYFILFSCQSGNLFFHFFFIIITIIILIFRIRIK